MLIHEKDPTKPLRHAQLKDCWRVGFTNFKLVKETPERPLERAAFYVTKYLSKSSLARVRASMGYKNTSSDIGSFKSTVEKMPPGNNQVVPGLTSKETGS